jgi:hypothetical protein
MKAGTVSDTGLAIEISKEIFELFEREGRIVVNVGFPHGIPVPYEMLTSEKFRNAVQKGVFKNSTVLLMPETRR